MDDEYEFDAGEELRYAEQGDMSVADYCWRLKALADLLTEQGEPVAEEALTLQMIRGVSPRFMVVAAVLLVQPAVPRFMEAFARLHMVEFDQNHSQDEEISAAVADVIDLDDLGEH